MEQTDWRAIKKGGIAGVTVIVTALRLAEADLRQLGVGADKLIAAGAEQNFRLAGQIRLQQQPQSHGSPGAEGNQTRRRAGGRIKIERADEGRRFRAKRDVPRIVLRIGERGDADLP